MFTGLQRKRHFFETPKWIRDPFAMRSGRKTHIIYKCSLVCSENMIFVGLVMKVRPKPKTLENKAFGRAASLGEPQRNHKIQKPQNQMFTGLQRKRHLFFTPQSSDDTFALRPGRNGYFFCERSPFCSENVDFFQLQGYLSDFCSTSWPKRPLNFQMFTGLQRER